MTNPPSTRGYIEGYYGRLLSWEDRGRLLRCLERLSMNAYLYAPKEDPCHRLDWRSDWDGAWWKGFKAFAKDAGKRGVSVMAALAPGMDFNFASLEEAADGNDAAILLGKAGKMAKAGADRICLLLDDIDPIFEARKGPFAREGEAHAALANALAGQLDRPVCVMPRIYADEVTDEAEGYLDAFAARLDDGVSVLTCGSHIVAPSAALADTGIVRAGIDPRRLVVWDNLYANDYCPRRLFLGPWKGREEAGSIMLNPTGMVETDCLLLALTRAGPDRAAWRRTLVEHGVPEEFLAVAAYFDLPPDPGQPPEAGLPDTGFPGTGAEGLLAALDTLLWRWKGGLQREWYPFLMGLRADILYRDGRMDPLRVEKTFPPLLAPLGLKDPGGRKE